LPEFCTPNETLLSLSLIAMTVSFFSLSLQLNGKDPVALGIIVEIDKLFELDVDGTARDLGVAEIFP
jgi:hypothetical protein